MIELALVLIRLAARNVRRQARRSLLTASAMILGIGLLVVARAGEAGSHVAGIESAVRLGAGHVAVEHPDHQVSQDLADRLSGALLARAESTVSALPEATAVRAVVPRLAVGGLAQSATSSIPVRVVGVDPAREVPVSFLAERVRTGRFLQAGDRLEAVVGSGLAERLRVELGSRLVLMAQGATGELESQLVRVTGVFRTGIPEVDRGLVQLPLETARQWLGVDGDATSLSLVLTSDRHTAEVARALREGLDAAQVPAGQAAVRPWWESMPDLHASLRADRSNTYIMFLILLTIVALAVVNSVLMAVLYRTREFGVLRALGLNRRAVWGMVMVEGILLTLASGALGMLLGVAVVRTVWRNGMNFAWLVSEDQLAFGGTVFDLVVMPVIQANDLAAIVSIVMGIGFLASLYPAWQATRIEVAAAMKTED